MCGCDHSINHLCGYHQRQEARLRAHMAHAKLMCEPAHRETPPTAAEYIERIRAGRD